MRLFACFLIGSIALGGPALASTHITFVTDWKAQAEHGGFSHDDTNVILLLSHSGFEPNTVRAEVGTAQVAPTILRALGLDPSALNAVRVEGTSVLPAVQFK